MKIKVAFFNESEFKIFKEFCSDSSLALRKFNSQLKYYMG